MVVPIGDQVTKRAPGIAERNSAIHATSTLAGELILNYGQLDFAPITDAFLHAASCNFFPFELEKASNLSHDFS
jgi:hypothetical protein